MDDIRLKYYSPVVTGTPGSSLRVQQERTGGGAGPGGVSFQDVLQEQLNQSGSVNFSKHAVKRAMEHNLEITEDSLARLNEGVRLAGEKKLDDTLILVGNTAFVVNVPNNTVITALSSNDAKGNVFTNINGTVII